MNPGQQALSLTAISSLVAATTLGRRATAAYSVLAVVVSALLGIYDQQYTTETAPTRSSACSGSPWVVSSPWPRAPSDSAARPD